MSLHHLDVAHQLRHTLERVVLALDRDQHLGGRHERIDGQQSERRRAVDEDVVEVEVVQLAQRAAQPILARHHADQFDLRARQIDRGRHAEEALAVRAAPQRVLQRDLADEHFVGRGRAGLAVGDAQRRARVALWVEIDDERLESLHGERGGEVDGGGGLAYPALLVRDGEDPALTGPRQRLVGGVQDSHCPLCRGADRGVEFG